MKNDKFQPIMNRFGKRCNDWNERFMSQVAKEVNIKAVVQALPRYVMGVFKLNIGFCEKYQKIISDFRWGDKDDQRKVHCMSWDCMTKPKRDGGICFRDMYLFNQALLTRQGWTLETYPETG